MISQAKFIFLKKYKLKNNLKERLCVLCARALKYMNTKK